MRAGYGEKLRKFFLEYNPKILIDLGPGVFESATVDTNILLIQKSANKNELKALNLQKDDKQNIDKAFKLKSVNLTNLGSDAWFIGSEAEQRLKEKIESIGKPLKDWDVKIYRGITTGLNEAFIITTEKRNEILDNCKDEEERKCTEAIIKPILRGRDINRYYYEWANLWIIWSFQGIDIDKYSSVKAYLNKYRSDLEKKTGGAKWYELQTDSAAHIDEFEKEKVVWQELAQGAQFAYDINGEFFVSNTGYILTGKNLKYMLGYLNSTLNEFTFKKWYCTQLGTNGIRWLNQHVLEIPIPLITPNNEPIVTQIETLVAEILTAKKQDPQTDTKQLERQIDQLVYQLYDLTEDEIRIIEN
jgi:hypothetical protein